MEVKLSLESDLGKIDYYSKDIIQWFMYFKIIFWSTDNMKVVA